VRVSCLDSRNEPWFLSAEPTFIAGNYCLGPHACDDLPALEDNRGSASSPPPARLSPMAAGARRMSRGAQNGLCREPARSSRWPSPPSQAPFAEVSPTSRAASAIIGAVIIDVGGTPPAEPAELGLSVPSQRRALKAAARPTR